MPTFKSPKPEVFDDIEYEVVIQPWFGKDDCYRIMVPLCDGDYKESPRIYMKEPTESDIADELNFLYTYWTDQLEDRSDAIVSERTHYRAYKIDSSGRTEHLGHGGRSFRFIKLDTGEELVSNNVWFQGQIPAFASRAFPDTHSQRLS